MSVDCLETDNLASIGAALEWQLPERLDHLARCAQCRESLLQLGRLRQQLLEVPPVEGVALGRPHPRLPPVRPGGTLWGARWPSGTLARARLAGALVTAATVAIAAATLLLAAGLLGGGGGPGAP